MEKRDWIVKTEEMIVEELVAEEEVNKTYFWILSCFSLQMAIPTVAVDVDKKENIVKHSDSLLEENDQEAVGLEITEKENMVWREDFGTFNKQVN